jgi:hypothetical protein
MKSGKLVSGLSNFRIDAIQAHEVLEQHEAATKVAEQLPLEPNPCYQGVIKYRQSLKTLSIKFLPSNF